MAAAAYTRGEHTCERCGAPAEVVQRVFPKRDVLWLIYWCWEHRPEVSTILMEEEEHTEPEETA